MGMFDTIVWGLPCPVCGTTIPTMQSKDDDCELKKLTPRQLIERREWKQLPDSFPGRLVRQAEVHGDCDRCGTWFRTYITQHRDWLKPATNA